MKRIAIIVTALVFPFLLMGQTKKFEYTPKVKNKIEISNLLGEISLQNSSGNAIVIESDFNLERPDRAAGLKLLGAMEDNTELGVNVSEENGIVSIQGATRQVRDYKYKILVPDRNGGEPRLRKPVCQRRRSCRFVHWKPGDQNTQRECEDYQIVGPIYGQFH